MLGKSLFCTKEIHRIGIKNQIAKYIRNRMCALKGAFLNGSGARTTKRELESVGIAVTCGSRVAHTKGVPSQTAGVVQLKYISDLIL